jgi:hypothetical protein
VNADEKPEGLGVARYEGQGGHDGDRYEGQVENGKRQGVGRLVKASSDTCSGFWENNYLQRGTYVPQSRNWRYEGEFHNYKMEGIGKKVTAEGNIYLGEFRNGCYDGKGSLRSGDGSGKVVYRGLWQGGSEATKTGACCIA